MLSRAHQACARKRPAIFRASDYGDDAKNCASVGLLWNYGQWDCLEQWYLKLPCCAIASRNLLHAPHTGDKRCGPMSFPFG